LVIANFCTAVDEGTQTMKAKVVLLPNDLKPADAVGSAIVVFDVIRATTTMTAALAADVQQIRVFDSLDAARDAAAEFAGPKVLSGENRAVRPPGFDLGNSPLEWTAGDFAGRIVFMATTNGTRAIAAAAALNPSAMFAGALVNAKAIARCLLASGFDVTLLCSGTGGEVSMEDLLGTGAVLDEIMAATSCNITGDSARIALQLFRSSRDDLPKVLRSTVAAGHVISASLEPDLDYCAALNSVPIAGQISPDMVVVRSGLA
jgi:2-phosphosulfolactate phosphatase